MTRAFAHRAAVLLLLIGSGFVAPDWLFLWPPAWVTTTGVVLIAVACGFGLTSLNVRPSQDPEPHLWLGWASLWSLLLLNCLVIGGIVARMKWWAYPQLDHDVFLLGRLVWLGLALLAVASFLAASFDRPNWYRSIGISAAAFLNSLPVTYFGIGH